MGIHEDRGASRGWTVPSRLRYTSRWCVGADLPRAALESLALEGYRAGALTHAQVRRLLGFGSLAEADGFLKHHGVYLEYTLDDLERDTANSRHVTR